MCVLGKCNHVCGVGKYDHVCGVEKYDHVSGKGKYIRTWSTCIGQKGMHTCVCVCLCMCAHAHVRRGLHLLVSGDRLFY